MTKPRIGALRHRVTLEAVARVADGGGGATETWVPVADVWASITPSGGTESTPSEVVSGRTTLTVVLRHRSDVVPAMRLRFAGRRLEITAVHDLDERRHHLKLLCRERDL